MSWALGYDVHWRRDVGYGVPAYCDAPGCEKEIHRGLSYVCGGEPYGGDRGCGLYFCASHLYLVGNSPQRCKRCVASKPPYQKIKPDHPTWIKHKLTDPSWEEWRISNPNETRKLQLACEEVK